MTVTISPRLHNQLQYDSLLFESEWHGLHHWQTVERNGLYLAEFTKADPQVISYFAYLHDCCRENEFKDPEHGPRAAAYAKLHRGLIELNDEQFAQLCRACSGHTFGRKSECITVATCWDADRLDIGRVGIQPDARYLFSDEAKRIADDCDIEALPSLSSS